jgi:hypothetical protein
VIEPQAVAAIGRVGRRCVRTRTRIQSAARPGIVQDVPEHRLQLRPREGALSQPRPAPTTAPEPTSAMITAPLPIHAPAPIVTGVFVVA